MPTFVADGLKIAYDDVGDGDPIVLLHGFAADKRSNWRLTGWYRLLNDAGFRVIAPDSRGHGASDRPTDPEAYAPACVTGDLLRLLDHLELDEVDALGYSMGGRNLAWLLTRPETRLRSAVMLVVVVDSVVRAMGFSLSSFVPLRAGADPRRPAAPRSSSGI